MDDLIQQGIDALHAGNRDEARKILLTVIKQQPDSERAWGWMYNAANTDQERIYCLKEILRINPQNEKANQLLYKLMEQRPSADIMLGNPKAEQSTRNIPVIKNVPNPSPDSKSYTTISTQETEDSTRNEQKENNVPKSFPKKWPIWAYVLVTLLIIGGICLCVSIPNGLDSNVVTMAEFNQIQTGMSYEQVVKIIGAPGEEMSRVDLAGYLTIMYGWNNPNGSNMNAMFQNGFLISKAQFGLK